jgi:phosphonate transport system permease protein
LNPRRRREADVTEAAAQVRKPAEAGRGGGALVGMALAGGVLAWAWHGVGMDPVRLVANAGNSLEFLGAFARPDFSGWRDYLRELTVTLQMALWGSVLATAAAIPLGLLGAANLSPGWIRHPVRRLLDALRAINEMVFAFVFMVAVGLGPFAGTLALAVHTTGVLGKLFSEVVEGIDPRQLEGIRSTGAGVLEEVSWAVIPQVLPLWLSHALYRFESNVRSATVVGIVGAGGMGYLLNEYFRTYEYGRVSVVVMMIAGLVTSVDLASSWLRRRVL